MFGIASRKTAAVTVVVLSQIAGITVLAAAWTFGPALSIATISFMASGGGIGGGRGIVTLYAVPKIGRMGIVPRYRPAVVGATVPVAVGFARGERPGLHAVLVVVCALALAVARRRLRRRGRRVDFRLDSSRPGSILCVPIGTAWNERR
jgi:hypothetical protein